MARTVSRPTGQEGQHSSEEESREVSEQLAREDNRGIFTEKGIPLRFWFALPTTHAARLSKLVTKHGGEEVLAEEKADVIIASESRIDYYRGKYRSLPQPYVELPSRIREWIRRGEVTPTLPIKKGMGGRMRPGLTRVEFTAEDRRHLCEYLARVIPNKKSGGRTGQVIYKRLVEDVNLYGPKHPNAWAKRHTWQSWREHYKKHQAELDPVIEELAEEYPDVHKGIYELDRGANRKSRVVYHEEEDEDEEEEEDVMGSSNAPHAGRKRDRSEVYEEEEEEEEEDGISNVETGRGTKEKLHDFEQDDALDVSIEMQGKDAEYPIVIHDSDDDWIDRNDPLWLMRPSNDSEDEEEAGPSDFYHREVDSPQLRSSEPRQRELQSITGKIGQRPSLLAPSAPDSSLAPPTSSQATLVDLTQMSQMEGGAASVQPETSAGQTVVSPHQPRKKPVKRRRLNVIPDLTDLVSNGPPAHNTRARSRSVEALQPSVGQRKDKGKQKAAMDRVSEDILEDDDEQAVAEFLGEVTGSAAAAAAAAGVHSPGVSEDDARTSDRLFSKEFPFASDRVRQSHAISRETSNQATHFIASRDDMSTPAKRLDGATSRIYRPRYSYGRTAETSVSSDIPSSKRKDISLPMYASSHHFTPSEWPPRSIFHDAETTNAEPIVRLPTSSFTPLPGTRAAQMSQRK